MLALPELSAADARASRRALGPPGRGGGVRDAAGPDVTSAARSAGGRRGRAGADACRRRTEAFVARARGLRRAPRRPPVRPASASGFGVHGAPILYAHSRRTSAPRVASDVWRTLGEFSKGGGGAQPVLLTAPAFDQDVTTWVEAVFPLLEESLVAAACRATSATSASTRGTTPSENWLATHRFGHMYAPKTRGGTAPRRARRPRGFAGRRPPASRQLHAAEPRHDRRPSGRASAPPRNQGGRARAAPRGTGDGSSTPGARAWRPRRQGSVLRKPYYSPL